ncbi:MAG: hypothetical protein MUE96_08005 [Bacteroidia bacterium]|nr:hypothetical protein [Bacteroidia bacterium]
MEKQNQDRNTKVAMILKYAGVIMAIFYLVMGIAVLTLPMFTPIEPTYRYIFAGMLLTYGAFRAYRIFR